MRHWHKYRKIAKYFRNHQHSENLKTERSDLQSGDMARRHSEALQALVHRSVFRTKLLPNTTNSERETSREKYCVHCEIICTKENRTCASMLVFVLCEIFCMWFCFSS